ncbi:MAG: SUMF1/EgtB/PvdO family nonheme iron enzyme [Kiritimatiellae bacterium]|nr:SUMF1/EgtB/PvdO family nonheme iron enzyme [Kiritimatiellia bacterium]
MNTAHKLFILHSALCILHSLAASAASVSSVTFDFNALNRLATVNYALSGAPAIVTADIQTNRTGTATADAADWISVGAANAVLIGDVHTLVETDGDHKILWKPDATFGDLSIAPGAIRAVVTAWDTLAPPDYLVVDLVNASNRWYYASEASLPHGGIGSDYYRQDAIVMRRIPAAGVKWTMGAPSGKRFDDTNVQQHYVRLTNDYYMAVFELTIGQLRKFASVERVGTAQYINRFHYWDSRISNYVSAYQYYVNYYKADTNNCPAVEMGHGFLRCNTGSSVTNWPGGRHWVYSGGPLGKMRARTGVDFDLPTEAQWEFACRAGTGTMTPSGDFTASTHSSVLSGIAWYNGNRPAGYSNWCGPVHRVGTKNPNQYGLYYMIGNVGEACLDWYAADYGIGSADVTTTVFVEPEGPATGSGRVCRGYYARYDYPGMLSATRSKCDTGKWYGARLMCPVGLLFPAKEKKAPTAQ